MPIAKARDYAAALMQPDAALPPDYETHIMPRGGVDVVIQLAEPPVTSPELEVRRISWLEAHWHWLGRVHWVVQRISKRQRKQSRLGWWSVLTDLQGAYHRASLYRGVSYTQWLALNSLTAKDKRQAGHFMVSHPVLPRIDVRIEGDSGSEAYALTCASLQQQWYRRFSLVEKHAPVTHDWLILLKAGDRLPEHALLWFAAEAQSHAEAAMIYADDDVWTGAQRSAPRFKPNWSALTFEYHDYIGRAVMLNTRQCRALQLLPEALKLAGLRSAMLALAHQLSAQVVHIPAVLLHLGEHHAPVQPAELVPVCAATPLVSIIIPTRDTTDYVIRCVDSVFALTTYQHYEVTVIDNGSEDRRLLDYLAAMTDRHANFSVIHDDRSFNYSALNNEAVKQAKGEMICFLNNDIEVITVNWLEQLLHWLQMSEVGVVGAKLYYADDTIQHAGVVVGPGGCANHLHAFVDRREGGYCERATYPQELSAVTAACMLTRKSTFEALGGFEAEQLPVAFNDVDFCLRVRKSGLKVMWTPYAELYHFESVSRRKDQSRQRQKQAEGEVRYMRKTWQAQMRHDPFYNPNFSYLRADFVLAPVPDVHFPWQSLA